mmetsp:Transcript_14112/g.36045  ORF Transcript_14112/g.36045 Transcript_14112/m.36045 type:complete len:242 (-) Transcript_14112:248-973(-)
MFFRSKKSVMKEEEDSKARQQKKVFGEPIEPEGYGPPLLGKMVRYLLAKGMDTPRLFLEEVDPQQLKQLKRVVKAEKESIHLSRHTQNPHLIAEMMVVYLKCLPEPLLCHRFYDTFLNVMYIVDTSAQLGYLRFYLQSLPQGFLASLRLVVDLLRKLCDNEAITGLSLDTVAHLFCSIIVRPKKLQHYMKDDEALRLRLVRMLILNNEFLFTSGATSAIPLPNALLMPSPVAVHPPPSPVA